MRRAARVEGVRREGGPALNAASIEVRDLALDDLRQAPPLLMAEGWAFEPDDLRRLHRLGGAVGAFEQGRMVGFLSYVDHAPLRWIGNVAVAPHLRGRGLGARIVARALDGVPRAGLYAVEKAVTLYARLGFEAQGEAFAFRAEHARPLRPSATEPLTKADLLDVARYDRQETTLDRGLLLRELVAAYPGSARLVRHQGVVLGYGVAKTYSDLTEIGPLVASAPKVAEDLLDALLAATPGPHEATALGANRRALAHLEARGFRRAFRTVPMFRGQPPAWRVGSLGAAAGLEKG